ncbi:MAG: mannose-1-phosphate guanylyltransferase/mannose-6-phosphate isomerase [Parvularculaceae bacterium]|nr:mannose-1-phosphate guanylyltransferase/mannose-6-phosphate isomerase [Parvularculaceae bacterium]
MTTRAIIQPVIMSGGAGTRLWPMSRAARPKQFLPLVSRASLFQETAERMTGGGAVDFAAPIVIAGAAHADIIAAQLEDIGVRPAAIIIEPCPRNTAAVAAVAAAWTAQMRPGALCLLAPADHHIADPDAFRAAVAQGAGPAAKGAIVTFGVRPSEPHTGYGYIEAGAPISDGVAEVAAFREKPDRQTAEQYLKSGRYFWNAGIFLYAPDAMTGEIAAFAPAIGLEAAAALSKAAHDGVICRLDAARFAACPADSIDYAVMERTARAAVVGPLDAGWSDIGAWTALEGGAEDARVAALDCDGVVIRTDGPFIGAIGVSDLIIVATGDAVLVAPKSRAQDVKKIIDELKARGREDLL